MISQDELNRWVGIARRDDWHMHVVGSDIRVMLGDIQRLREALEPFAAYAAKGGSDKARDLKEVICKIMENAPYPADLNAINQFCAAVLAARDLLGGAVGGSLDPK
jgi:hypothetical protein